LQSIEIGKHMAAEKPIAKKNIARIAAKEKAVK
jgi:hypothetical protein